MTEITETERTALRDPKIRQGAELEADFRRRARKATGHAELLDYLDALAETCDKAYASAELAAWGAWVFAAGSRSLWHRLRLARIVLLGRDRWRPARRSAR